MRETVTERQTHIETQRDRQKYRGTLLELKANAWANRDNTSVLLLLMEHQTSLVKSYVSQVLRRFGW